MPTTNVPYNDRPLVIAHRGASDVAPENTLAAFQAAIEADADGIELDVTRCATGEIVVIHDDTLDRTTNGSGPVSVIPFFSLRELDAGSWFGPDFADQRIPLLQEVLDLAGQRVKINIEIKSRGRRSDGIEEEIAAMIRARGLGKEVIISSFNPAALLRIKRVAPELPRGLLYSPGLPIPLARAWFRPLVKPDALHPHSSIVNDRYMRSAHRRGYQVNVWTVNSLTEMHRMIAAGVDGIITDHPARLRQLTSP